MELKKTNYLRTPTEACCKRQRKYIKIKNTLLCLSVHVLGFRVKCVAGDGERGEAEDEFYVVTHSSIYH